MSQQPGPERGAAEDASGAPLTPTEVEASLRPPSDLSAGSSGRVEDTPASSDDGART
jgi:hypothetical protein